MAPNPTIMQAVEKLGYRVTIGDVATQAGLNVAEASQGLLALASDAGGHLQVAESGDIVYLFPQNFREILRNKYLQLRLQEWWKKVWGVIFYLIRISFGIFLIASIALITITISSSLPLLIQTVMVTIETVILVVDSSFFQIYFGILAQIMTLTTRNGDAQGMNKAISISLKLYFRFYLAMVILTPT